MAKAIPPAIENEQVLSNKSFEHKLRERSVANARRLALDF